jgi:uncharacterized protein
MKGILAERFRTFSTMLTAAMGHVAGFPARSSPERVIVFTRYPEPGKTKTRLIPRLGPDGAAGLQRYMTEHVIEQALALKKGRPISIEVRYDGGNRLLMSRWLGRDVLYREQRGQDLGDRMLIAFQDAFAHGMERVLLFGTDCPNITSTILEKGFHELVLSDLVLGPAADGGYYLIGMKRPYPLLFAGIPWGTNSVLEKTIEKARTLKLSVALVDTLEDVDRPEDFHLLPKERLISGFLAEDTPEGSVESASGPGRQKEHADENSLLRGEDTLQPCEGSGRVSVIVPTINEETNLPETLEKLVGMDDVEVIVSDGGSNDRTRETAEAYGATVVQGRAGRAAQMNAGAGMARGNILVFLHADTRLPEDWLDHVRAALATPGIAAGAFSLGIDGNRRSLRVIEKLANFRSRRFQLPYGDQAIFVKADLFRRIGGYADLPIMEDVELIARLRKYGRIRTAHERVLTSSRRWTRIGVLRTTAINQIMMIGYKLGVAPATLSRLYHRDRGK